MNIPSNFFNSEVQNVKAYGIDEIPRRFLKDEAEFLTETLQNYQPFLKF